VNTCFICEQSEPPHNAASVKKVLPKRSVKNNKSTDEDEVLWIKCSTCRKWYHLECCGLLLRDYKKLTQDKQFFKCIICCLKVVPADRHANILQRVNEARGNTPLSAGNNSVNTALQIGPKAVSQEDSKSNGVEENIDTAGAISVEYGFALNGRKVLHEKVSVPVDNDIECAVTKLSFDGDTLHCTPNTPSANVRSKPPTSSLDEVSVSIIEESERKNIIIVDHIPNAGEFVNSTRILKEVKFFSPDITVKYAYSLAKGGIAIHLHSRLDKERLLQSLTTESFGGGKVYDLDSRQQTLFIKGVATSVTTDRLRETFIANGVEVNDLVRLTQNKTGRPLPVVKVICSTECAKKLLKSAFINVNGIGCRIEKKRVDVQRCYNCHRYGHIARVCNSPSRCVNCSEHHNTQIHCSAITKCANYGGPHRASSSNCPIYQQKYEDLTGQRTESKHLEVVDGNGHPKASTRHPAAAGGLVP